jgi:hypothetical protein
MKQKIGVPMRYLAHAIAYKKTFSESGQSNRIAVFIKSFRQHPSSAVENNQALLRIGTSIKREYSNETIFIDEQLNFNNIQHGLFDISKISGIAIMSDGSSERLVSTDGKTIAKRLFAYFEKLRNVKLHREDLYKFLTDYDAWEESTHDDKTLILASR